MKEQHSKARRSGFTLVELLVVIGVIVVLIALLLPAIGVVRGRARSAQCQSNLAELGIALGKANGTMPEPLRASEWPVRLSSFLDGEAELLNCPESEPDESANSYGMNDRVHRMQGGDGGKIAMLDYLTEQAEVVRGSLADQNWESSHDPRHRGQMNVLLQSGAVATHDAETIDPTYCKPFLDFWRPLRDHSTMLQDCSVVESPASSTDDTTGSTTDSTTDATTDGNADGSDDGSDPLCDAGETSPPSGPGSGYVPGLFGEWHKGDASNTGGPGGYVAPDPTSPVIETRTDPDLNLPYGFHGANNFGPYPFKPPLFQGPFTNFPDTSHLVVYTGQLWIPYDGPIAFWSKHDDVHKLWIDGQQLMDNWVPSGHIWTLYEVGQLTNSPCGQWVDILVWSGNCAGPNFFLLQWQYGSNGVHNIPPEYFRTAQ